MPIRWGVPPEFAVLDLIGTVAYAARPDMVRESVVADMLHQTAEPKIE